MKGGKKKGKKKKDNRTVRDKLQDLQLIYKEILTSLTECCKAGGVRAKFKGKKCLFKPFLLVILGDAKGFNSMVCHFNSNGNASVACLVKDCFCGFPELISSRPECVRVTREDLKRAEEDADYAKSI